MASDQENLARRVLRALIESVMNRIGDQRPRKVSSHDLHENTAAVLSSLYRDNQAAIITFRGVPSALLVPLDRDDARAVLLGVSPTVQARIASSEAALAETRRTDAPMCNQCGVRMLPVGPCFVCVSCGATTGCK